MKATLAKSFCKAPRAFIKVSLAKVLCEAPRGFCKSPSSEAPPYLLEKDQIVHMCA